MRRLRYHVAMSLDGFIAGPNGVYDWIKTDSSIDFVAIFAQFDTALMGRKTFDTAREKGHIVGSMGQRWVVVSRTLRQEDHPQVTILHEGIPEAVAALKAESGKDIWLFGGGMLFRSLLDAGLVDTVEVALMPVMLGSGVPLIREGRRQWLLLQNCNTLASGILMLSYSVVPATEAA